MMSYMQLPPFPLIPSCEQQETNNIIYPNSFFIPHVFNTLPLPELVKYLENVENVGTIQRIESIPKTNLTDGHEYYSCFVFLENWSTCDNATYIRGRLYENESVRLFYNDTVFITLLPNKSSITQLADPEHMDLCVCLYEDMTEETVLKVMEGLDLGKVEYVEIQPYTSYTNPHWYKPVEFKYNLVTIRFKYWYKTRVAYSFQSHLALYGSVNVSVFGVTSCWTFYHCTPALTSVNPYVWVREGESDYAD